MKGCCLCGAVVFEVTGTPREVIACHCSQCRKWSGHVWAASSVPVSDFRLIRQDGLAWYRASASARRGFCRCCGASLFWMPDGEPRVSFAAGAIDGPTGLKLARHIFIADAGDYYAPVGPPPAPGPVPTLLTGACLCGAARFTLPGPAGPVTACHCRQCRKTSGHYSASFDTSEAGVIWQSRATIAEYRASGGSQRGFCTTCGSNLDFRATDGSFSVEAGAIIGATGGRLESHIFVADKGDYHTLDDGLPRHAGRA